jgi:16S rRNA G966 N2-methylase RsmD
VAYADGVTSGNVLYYGDNLDVLRQYIPDESVDLIYLDPPFNSNATYNALLTSRTELARLLRLQLSQIHGVGTRLRLLTTR